MRGLPGDCRLTLLTAYLTPTVSHGNYDRLEARARDNLALVGGEQAALEGPE